MSLFPDVPKIPYADVTKLITANTAFVNPFASINSLATSRITQFKTFVTSVSTVGNSLYDAGVATNATAILASISTIQTTLGRFSSHTDNLSGVSLSTGLTGANFATISTIVSTVQKYKDNSICDVVNGVFGAIQNLASIITSINQLLGQLDNILTIPSQISTYIDNLKNLLESQIQADLLNFATAQLTALQLAAAAALTSLIGNACVSDVITKIGTDELKKIVIAKSNTVFK